MSKPSLTKSFFITGFSGVLLVASYTMPASAEASATGLFGSVEIPSSNLAALPQWNRVIENFEKTQNAAMRCDKDIQKCTSQQMTLWRAKIQELKNGRSTTMVREINKFINKWRHVSDAQNYKHDDYWATPLEFITYGGDSEDFAIMKYISLKELGISAARMRIVVTNDVLRGVTHTVLSVHLGKRRYVLDSQNDTVLTEQFVKYYVPFYSINETTRWAHFPGQTSALKNAGGVEKSD